MIQKVLVTPIIGLPQMNGWAQVIQSSDGQFICSFSIYGSQAGNVGRDLVDLIKNNSPDSATAVYSLMKRIVRFIGEKDCNIEISSAFFGQSQTIFAAYNGSLLLKRDGKVGSILQAQGEIKVIEGKKNTEDIFVLSTNSALEFKEEIFQKLSQGLDADTTVASIVPGVQNLDNSSLISMAFLSDLPSDYNNGGDNSSLWLESEDNQSVKDNRDSDFVENGVSDKSINNDLAIEIETNKNNFKFDKKKITSLLRTVLSFFKKVLIGFFRLIKKIIIFFKRLFTNDVYVDEATQVSKKRLRIVILSVIVILSISLTTLAFKLRANGQVREATQEISSLLLDFEKVKILVEEDPIKSREEITLIIEKLEVKEKAYSNKKIGQEYIINNINLIREYFDTISGKEVFKELEVFFDFQLVESDFIASKVNLVSEIAYFFDNDKRKLIKLELENKKVEVISLEEQELLEDFTVTDADIYLLSEGIYKKSLSDEKIEKIIDEGKSNREARFIDVFNNNVYILNKEQRNIYKYSYDLSSQEYSDPIRWVKSAKDLEFDLVNSISVDGDIWLSTRLGQIFKLSGGEGSVFEINGLLESLTSQTYLFTKPDYNNIYLLEPSSSRLVIVSKDGDFIKEIKSISLASASGFAVSESLNKAVIISGSLVFEVGL